jgi:hypothetical protein
LASLVKLLENNEEGVNKELDLMEENEKVGYINLVFAKLVIGLMEREHQRTEDGVEFTIKTMNLFQVLVCMVTLRIKDASYM